MALTLILVEPTCALAANEAQVAFQWNGTSPDTYELTLKQFGTPIYSHTGTLTSSYAFPTVVAGTYQAQVYNASQGYSNILNVTVDCSPKTLYANISKLNPTTIGGSDGTITLDVHGGYTPYTFLWSDGPTTQNRTGLAAGSYSVTISSFDGQSVSYTIVLTDPTACDLTITNIAITKESLRRVGDASIVVTVDTGNPGTIEYSLDNTTWQTSNTFTDMEEGDYTVYVRQSACTDEQDITISRRDARYYMLYDDMLGNVTRAELLESGFSGTGERICGSGEPVVIQWGSTDGEERYDPIKGSSCTVSFESDTDFKFLDLFTADNRKFRIDIYKGPAADDLNLYWTGFMLPELYSEPYAQPQYYVSLKAVDGLGMLKYTPFDLQSQSVAQISILKNILDTLDLHIPIVIADDLYETQMLMTIDDEPFAQSKVNTDVYVKNKKRMKALDVLKANLQLKYMRIYQDRGTLRITRYDLLRGVYGHRVYDKRWNFLYSEYVNPVQDIQLPTADLYPIFVNKNQELSIKTAFHEITATLTYGIETNLIADGDFAPSAFSDSETLINWTDTAHIEAREPFPGSYAVAITDDGTTPGFSLTSRPVYLYTGNGNSIHIYFDYFIKSSVLGSISPELPYQIKIGTKYWTGTGWSSSPTIILESPAAVNLTRRVEYNRLSVPEDGEFTLTLFAVIPHDFTVEEVQYSNAFGQFLPLGNPPPESATFSASQSIPYTFVPDDLTVLHGDAPSPVFASAITIQQVGSPTIAQSTEWKRNTVTEGKKIIQILIEAIAGDYLIPTQKITGDVMGHLYFGAAIRHTYNSNRVFVPSGVTFSDKSGIWAGEWLEALEVQPVAVVDPGDIADDTVIPIANGELTIG